MLWLVSCPSALWLVNSLDGVSVLPRPFPKQQVPSSTICSGIVKDGVNIAISIWAGLRPREYWTRGSRRTFARTDVARHIRVVMLLLFWARGWEKQRFFDMAKTWCYSSTSSSSCLMHSTKRSNHDLAPPQPPTIQISVGWIYFNDILMGCFVISQNIQRCSPNEPFVVVLEKGFLKKRNIFLWSELWDL